MAKPVVQTVANGGVAHPAVTQRSNKLQSMPRSTAGHDVSERIQPRRIGAVLWGLQGLLALVFLSAGVMKVTMPAGELTRQIGMPATFLRFIGVCEVLGALGLVLPGITRIRTALTPLAAAGLVVIMIGATAVTLAQGTVAPALLPLAIGLFAASVAYGRLRLLPLQPRRSPAAIRRQQVAAEQARLAA